MGPIFPSQFFSTFDMDKLGKIHPFCWKEDFLICKIAKFANDLLKTNEDIGPQSQMSVNFGNFVEVYPCSLNMYHFKTWEYY